jgi:hypothetical protein
VNFLRATLWVGFPVNSLHSLIQISLILLLPVVSCWFLFRRTESVLHWLSPVGKTLWSQLFSRFHLCFRQISRFFSPIELFVVDFSVQSLCWSGCCQLSLCFLFVPKDRSDVFNPLWTGFCSDFILADDFFTLTCSWERVHNCSAYLQSFKEPNSAVLWQFLQIRVSGGLVNLSFASLAAVGFRSSYSN